MKNKILFVVESAIYKNDGYKSRIEMEMDLLCDHFEFAILAPSDSNNRKIIFRHNVQIYYFNSFNDKIPYALNIFSLRKNIKKILEGNRYIVVCEALPAAALSLPICKKMNVKYVYDCHGTAADEVYLYHPNLLGYIYSKWLNKQEAKVVKYSDLAITVSESQYKKWKTTKDFCLLPMLPSSNFMNKENYKNEIREQLGIGFDKKVFVYSGQNQKWQMSKQTINYYKKLENDNTFLLVLTHQVNDFVNIIKREGIKSYKVLSVPYNDMFKYLDACDFGFCLRENHIINLVSSPTKVLEYLARNVMPILTKYVGDFSVTLNEKNLAYVLDDEWSINDYSKNLDYNGITYVKELSNKCKHDYITRMKELL